MNRRSSIEIRKPRHVSDIRLPGQEHQWIHHLPLYYSQLHGSLPRRNIRELRLQQNEFIILPDWNQTSYGCFTVPLRQILQQARTLQNVVKRIAQVFPRTQGSSEFRFQIFDSTKILPDLFLSTDENEAKGQLVDIGLPLQEIISLPSQFQTSNFHLSDVIHLLRQRSPEGWILVLFVCTILNVLDPPIQQRQMQAILRQQAHYSSRFPGFPLQEYFPHLSLKKQEPKIIQQAIRFIHEPVPEPILSSHFIPQGEKILAEYKGQEAMFDVLFQDSKGAFKGSTDLYLNGIFVKRFGVSHSNKVEIMPLDVPGFEPFQFMFQPVSMSRNGTLEPFRLTYRQIMPLFNIQKLYLRDKPWKIGGKDKFLEVCRNTSHDVSFYKIEFVTPFSFKILLIQENRLPKRKTWVLTQEKKIYNVSDISLQKKRIYASPHHFFLHDVMTRPFSDNIIIGTNPVAVFVDSFKEKSQRIKRIQEVQGSILPTEAQDWLFGRTDPSPQEQKRQLEKMLEQQQTQQDAKFHRMMSNFRFSR